MLCVGHMRELKELKSLYPFLQQVAAQTLCAVRLLQADGTSICEGDLAGECASADCCLRVRPEEIVTSWRSHSSLIDPWDTTCPAGKPLLALPICRGDRIDGILTVCSPAREHYPFLASVAEMINAYIGLARAAVHELEKSSNTLSAYEALYQQTEQLEEADDICRNALEVLLTYLDANVGIFVPHNIDGQGRESPIIKNSAGMDEAWLTSLSSLVSTMYVENRCPVIVTPENRAGYPEFEALGVSSCISAIISHEEGIFGLLVLCSQRPEAMLSFDALALLEALKGVIGLRLHDIRLQQLLTRRTKERFLHNAFHNLRAPVHSIAGIIEQLITDEEISPEERQAWLSLLHEQAQRLAHLTKQAAAFTRLQSAPRPRTQVSLKDIVKQSTQAFQVAAGRKHVHIEPILPTESCDTIADVDGLYEVLQNLLENALKVSHAGQTIQVHLTVESSNYRISVIDEGPGVPQEERIIIFEEFMSIPRGNGDQEGTGLGLPYARMIVEAHGGMLDYSDGPCNYGACFWFILPQGRVHQSRENNYA